MRLKSFYAKTMSEAMQMIRDTLGEDAVIVATREEKGAKGVRVTAAIDPSSYGEPAFELGRGGQKAAPAEDWLQYDAEDEEFAVAEELTEVMLRHAVPENVMDQVLSCATVIGLEQPRIALVAALEHLFHFRPLPEKAAPKPLMMVGPPGAGKTLAVAKIAARGVMNGLKVGVITADTVRAGGVEQLEAFTRLLRVDLLKVKNAQDLEKAVAAFKGCGQVLIDAPGANPFDAEDIKNLARLIGAADADPHLVMAGGGDADEAGETARAFAAIGAHTLLPTRLDIARRLGGFLSAAWHGNLAFAHASATARVADGLISLSPQSLAKLLMPSAGAPPAGSKN